MNGLVAEICRFVRERSSSGGVVPTPYPGLGVLYDTQPTRLEAMIYDPVVCLVLQGAKETYIGDRCIRFGAGESLIVSHAMPVTAAVTEASAAAPYVAMVLTIDLESARSLADELGVATNGREVVLDIEAAATDARLLDVMARLFRASLIPAEAKVLGPLYAREAHFCLLEADHAGMLRQMLWRDSAASRVGRAIARVRTEFAEPLCVADLAATASMSVSNFHQRFKALTSKSPLQFQKEIRLTEARRLLSVEGRNVSAAAFAVGYESPTQFSREYARKFGVPPRMHIARRSAA
ncbi:MAG: AraC family transcriptional regulator [Pseudomonadota bacterium]